MSNVHTPTPPTPIAQIVPEAGEANDSVLLDYDARAKRRAVWTTKAGRRIILDLERPQHLRCGQGFELEDGSLVRIEAAPEPLLVISASDPHLLTRLGWHLGNRHLPTQIVVSDGATTLRIRQDHVIEDMVLGLGGACEKVEAAFDPEGGAYEGRDGGHGHGSGHSLHHHGHHHHGPHHHGHHHHD